MDTISKKSISLAKKKQASLTFGFLDNTDLIVTRESTCVKDQWLKNSLVFSTTASILATQDIKTNDN